MKTKPKQKRREEKQKKKHSTFSAGVVAKFVLQLEGTGEMI